MSTCCKVSVFLSDMLAIELEEWLNLYNIVLDLQRLFPDCCISKASVVQS